MTTTPFDERRHSTSSNGSYFFPPLRQQQQQPTANPYTYPPPCVLPERRHSPSNSLHKPTSPLDHLANAAATSPPAATSPQPIIATERNSPRSNPDIDPNLGGGAPVSFPTFPHDIFNSGPQTVTTYTTKPTTPASETRLSTPVGTPTADHGTASSSSYSSSQDLPPKEILDIMYLLLERG